MNTSIPSIKDITAGFVFTENDITIDPRRPSRETITKLVKGLKRNARNHDSQRNGCRGAEMGHKWMCMQEHEWIAEQRILVRSKFENEHAIWQTQYNAVAESERDGWLDITINDNRVNEEPVIDDFVPPFPKIENPGKMMDFTGTEKQIQLRLIAHQQEIEEFRIETNVHKALKQLFVKIVPKPLYSDMIGTNDDDIDLYSLRELLDHLGKKYNRTTAKECDRIWEIFNSPMADLSPEQYFSRQIACQKNCNAHLFLSLITRSRSKLSSILIKSHGCSVMSLIGR